MNPRTMEFEPISEPPPPEKKEWPVFRVGDMFELNGVKMAVRKVTRRDVVLRPVK